MPGPPPRHPQLVRYVSAGWRGRADPDWTQRLAGLDPIAWVERCGGEPMNARPVIRTYRVVAGDEAVYVKHWAGPSDVSRRGRAWFDVLRWQLQHRARRIASTTERLRALGFHMPRTLLAARRRRGWRVEQLLVTAELAGRNCNNILRFASPAEARRVIRAAATAVAALHNAGFVHGEPHLANLVRLADGGIGFLDNDRTRRRPLLAEVARRRNVRTMLRNVYRTRGRRAAMRGLVAYASARGLGRGRRRRMWRRLAPRLVVEVRLARLRAVRHRPRRGRHRR
ncbi:MAG: lipopolysaccharide kinase InaA family protein [Phycisphaeraceae bacterium]